MGLFSKKDKSEKSKNSKDEDYLSAFQKLWSLDIEEIWKLTDVNSFITAMNGWISRKCDYGNSIEKLSSSELTVYHTMQLQSEVNNGGFSQYFFNAFGNISEELVPSFKSIGANGTAAICQRALDALGCELPSDREQRRKVLDNLLTDKVNAVLDEYDKEFYAGNENLEKLTYEFLIKNR